MDTKEARPDVPVVGAGAGFVLTALLVFAVLFFMFTSTYETWGGVLIAAVLVAVTIPVLRRQAEREESPALFWLLVAALLLKLVGALLRYYVVFDVYEGRADAVRYHNYGLQFYEQFRSGNFNTGAPLTGTHFIEFLTALVYAVIGPTVLGGFVVYSWLGFWGLFLFYRAFVLAVPEGRARTYARLVFFLPSLLFWPSSIGKEAWMMFCLGIAAFGSARALTGKTARGFLLATTGLWLAAMVRPHLAGMMGVALAGAFLIRPAAKEHRELAPLFKMVSLALVGALAVVLVIRTDRFLKEKNIDTDQGVTNALGTLTENTSQGGSAFAPSLLESPQRAPVAVVTVLFRPLVTEAHNTQAVVAGLEGLFLMVLCLFRVRWGFGALRSIRRQPYVAFALLYSAVYIFGFSAIANFGILVRQRSLVFPLFLVLIAIPPKPGRAAIESA